MLNIGAKQGSATVLTPPHFVVKRMKTTVWSSGIGLPINLHFSWFFEFSRRSIMPKGEKKVRGTKK